MNAWPYYFVKPIRSRKFNRISSGNVSPIGIQLPLVTSAIYQVTHNFPFLFMLFILYFNYAHRENCSTTCALPP